MAQKTLIINKKLICPLCTNSNSKKVNTDKERSYYLCENCNLIFVSSVDFLSLKEEKRRYDLHENNIDNLGYRTWLNNIFVPMNKILSPKAEGLDFGSGPEPALSVLFEEANYSMSIYDYFYAKEEAVFNRKYDFITASEVVEHLQEPKKELERLWKCLKTDGYLAIMTGLWISIERFSNWSCKRDLTHVCFFSKKTFIYLSKKWNAKISFINKNVVILQKLN